MMACVRQGRRRIPFVYVVLHCTCGFAERWPMPHTVHPGRCTCPRCGDQLQEPGGEPGAETAWKVAG